MASWFSDAELWQTALPGVTVFVGAMAVYKLFFEKSVQAQENVSDLMAKGGRQAAHQEKLRQKSEELVKKRRAKQAQNTTGKPKKLTAMEKLDIDLERANVLMRPMELILISAGLAILLTAVLWLLEQPPILAILAGFGAFQAPGVFIKIKAFLRMKKAADQFADVLDTMVNCFKTGYGFSRAVQQVADQFEDPWRTEFGKMAAEMALGAQMEDALNNLASRMPLPDVDLFVTAMVIQRETGGNLAELLGNLSNTCRDRYKLFRKIGAITAQGKLSAMVVGSVPFLLMAMMFMFMPEPTTEFATHPIGIILLVLAGIWMTMGIGVLFKLVSIKV